MGPKSSSDDQKQKQNLKRSTSSTNSSKSANQKTSQSNQNNVEKEKDTSTSTSKSSKSSGMDAHPFSRGSIIEVLWGVPNYFSFTKNAPTGTNGKKISSSKNEDSENDDDFDDFSDEEFHSKDKNEESNENEEDFSDEEKNEKGKKKTKEKGIPRLCDIIDRAQDTKYNEYQNLSKSKNANSSSTSSSSSSSSSSTTRWKYYVHYRDFNRRMDEWITIDRIISPPSIGSAKSKALIQEKQRQKKLQLQMKLKQQQMQLNPNAKKVDSSENNTKSNSSSSNKRKKRKDDDRQKRLLAEIGVSTDDAMNQLRMDQQRVRDHMNNLNRERSESRQSQRRGGSGNTNNTSGNGNSNNSSNVDGGDASTNASNTSNSMDLDPVMTPLPRTRRQIRKSRGENVDDISYANSGAATNNNSNNAGGGNSTSITGTRSSAVNSGEISKQQIGENIVATVEAQELDEHEGLDEASLREHEEVTKVKNVSEVQIGKYKMETWYFSPIPKELMRDGVVDVLYCCEFTLNFFTRKKELLRFQRKAGLRRHPPGNEIYRNGNLSMFEVDGFQERIYCQNLCYIAKLFLDHKTLYFDVDPFLFYVLCEVDNRGFHPVGYFSKEKYSDVGYNLACILTFPCHQRKGYGRFLISFSYELSKKEEKVGSPEKPMSDLGQKAYIPYWTSTIVDFLRNQMDHNVSSIAIMDMAKKTSIMAEDIIFTLNQLSVLKIINGVYFIAAEAILLEKLAKKHPVKEPRVDPTKLHWTPFLTDVKRDKFSIHSKKPSIAGEEPRGSGGF